jgi:hypothetical protein
MMMPLLLLLIPLMLIDTPTDAALQIMTLKASATAASIDAAGAADTTTDAAVTDDAVDRFCHRWLMVMYTTDAATADI